MKKDRKPLILVANDDGYNSNGIRALVKAARKFGDVLVAAPREHQSGQQAPSLLQLPCVP